MTKDLAMAPDMDAHGLATAPPRLSHRHTGLEPTLLVGRHDSADSPARRRPEVPTYRTAKVHRTLSRWSERPPRRPQSSLADPKGYLRVIGDRHVR